MALLEVPRWCFGNFASETEYYSGERITTSVSSGADAGFEPHANVLPDGPEETREV